MKFSDLGAARLRRTVGLPAATGAATLRASAMEVVEKSRSVVVIGDVMREGRIDIRLKSPVRVDVDAILFSIDGVVRTVVESKADLVLDWGNLIALRC